MSISESLRNTINELGTTLSKLSTKRRNMMACAESALLDKQIKTIEDALEALDEQRFNVEWDEANQ